MAEKIVRKRGWFLLRSWDYDSNDPTSKYYKLDEDTWKQGILEEWTSLAKLESMDWCHFVIHDRDEINDKDKITIKKIHAHAVMRFKQARTQSAVMSDWCGSNQRSENCSFIENRYGGYSSALLYLTHHSQSAYNEMKTWYHHRDVHQFGTPYLTLIQSDVRKKNNKQELEKAVDKIVEEIVDGEKTLAEARSEFREAEGAYPLVKYEDTFKKAFEAFRHFKVEEMRKLSLNGDFEKLTTYISGAGRSGKSTLAENLASLRCDGDVYIAPSGGSDRITSDFVDGYEVQRATVFNDLDPKEYGEQAFYTMFDPYKWSITKSRNSNKPWLSTECYIAVHWSIGEFIMQLINKSNIKTLQLSKENVNKLRMSFGRVQRVLQFGIDSNGDGFVWVMKLKTKLPTDDEVENFVKNSPNCNLGNSLDKTIAELFYDVLAAVPYDKNLKKPTDILNENKRIAKIINDGYNAYK